ncbi:MAG: hypothetical protein J2P25_24235 [Nocardiopsaceae bacterium]|nr:hypothetical protein [Nocardiopsaceae bacterium]
MSEYPLVSRGETTGFPSPAEDYAGPVSLDRELLGPAVFVMRAGVPLPAEGIGAGDELLVDRSLAPRDGSLVVASCDGELLARRLRLRPRPRLEAAGPGCPEVPVGPGAAEPWGVVTVVIRHV